MTKQLQQKNPAKTLTTGGSVSRGLQVCVRVVCGVHENTVLLSCWVSVGGVGGEGEKAKRALSCRERVISLCACLGTSL